MSRHTGQKTEPSPDSFGAGSGEVVFSRLLAAVVADNLVDIGDDVFGNLGLYRGTIDHLDEGDALVIILCDGYLAEHFVFASDN